MTVMGIEGADDDFVRDLVREMPIEITNDEYLRLTGETLGQTVDLARLEEGYRSAQGLRPARIRGERGREHLYKEVRKAIREHVFPAIRQADQAPKSAGVLAPDSGGCRANAERRLDERASQRAATATST